MVSTIVVLLVGYWFFKSPLCSACADWLRNQGGGRDPRLMAQMEELGETVTELRADVLELSERMDFTERVLIKVREREALPPR
jgi:hypothetical protein